MNHIWLIVLLNREFVRSKLEYVAGQGGATGLEDYAFLLSPIPESVGLYHSVGRRIWRIVSTDSLQYSSETASVLSTICWDFTDTAKFYLENFKTAHT